MKIEKQHITMNPARIINNSLYRFPVILLFLITGWQGVAFGQFDISTSKTDITCNGLTDGTITTNIVDANGASTFDYRLYYLDDYINGNPWITHTGQIASLSHTFNNLGKEDYVINVVSGKGDGATKSQTINEPDPLAANVSSTNINCFGESTGTITIDNESGGWGSYEYTINGGFSWEGSGNYTGLTAGLYDVSIRDAAALTCELILDGNLEITENPDLSATVNPTNVTCNGGADGSISISSPSGGTGTGYEYYITGYAWQSSGTFNTLTAGTYEVKMRDDAGCEKVLDPALTLTEPDPLSVTIVVVQDVTCNDASDAILRAEPSGGSGDFSYLWKNGPAEGQTTQEASGLEKDHTYQ